MVLGFLLIFVWALCTKLRFAAKNKAVWTIKISYIFSGIHVIQLMVATRETRLRISGSWEMWDSGSSLLVGGNKHFLFSPRSLGKWSNLTCAYFSNGLVQPPTRLGSSNLLTVGWLPTCGWTCDRGRICRVLRLPMFRKSASRAEKWGQIISWSLSFDQC